MFTSKSHGEFNDAFNDLACTRGVTYCGPWNLSVSNGREFMNQSYDTVGRIYASELLHNSAGGPLAGASEGHAHFTPMQRAALQHLAATTDSEAFDEALMACIKHGVLADSAASVFSPQNVIASRTLVGQHQHATATGDGGASSIALEEHAAASPIALEERAVAMEDAGAVSLAPEMHMSPAVPERQLHMNSPNEPNLSLTSKRRKKKK